MRLAVLTTLMLGLYVPGSVAAESDRMTTTQFYRLTHILMSRPSQHGKFIKHCAGVKFSPLAQAELEAAAKIQKLQAHALTEEACRRLVKGIADGRMTYTDYMKWMDDADRTGVVVLPDWE